MQNHIAVFPITAHSETIKVQGYLNAHFQKAIDEEKPLVVRISQQADDRTAAQNRLMWMWIGQIERKTGQDKDSLHHEFKKKWLIFIYRRDDQQFAEMCSAIGNLKQSEPDEYKIIGEQVVRLASTTKATVKQMTEYLNYIFDYAATRLGIHLTVPDDLKWCYQG